ncbi:hypothetical protein SDC9_178512 [bioreactor metagenome]|uniref:Uncharacterized protein n=1 Tax=bioreactor metagenome TaxID=1076179 RepID=A0A645GVY3_9ZZZZ
MTDVFEQQLVERIHIVILCGRHLFEDIRMAANCPLTEDHHATGQNVRAFYGDGDRRALIGPRQEITFAQHNALATGDIHRVNN